MFAIHRLFLLPGSDVLANDGISRPRGKEQGSRMQASARHL
jgi:hypothetical protein